MKLKRFLFVSILSCFCLTLLVSDLEAQAAFGNWAERFASKMTPQLEIALADLSPDATLDVYAVMKNRMATTELFDLVEGLPVAERHRIVTRALRDFADRSQSNLMSLLAQRCSAVELPAPRQLWLSNSVRFTATAEEIEAVRDLSGVGYVGLIRDYPIETYRDVATPGDAGFPFYDGFESGGFSADWTTSTTGTGRIQVTSANGPIGNYHVTMDSTTSATYGTAEMTLTIDLASVSNAFLSFSFKEFSDETDPEGNVSISENGVTWYNVLNLSGSSTYESKYIDLDDAAATHGISFNSAFKIRFSWRDNYPIATDGFAFDEIHVDPGDPPPTPPTPNIVNLQAPQCWEIGDEATTGKPSSMPF